MSEENEIEYSISRDIQNALDENRAFEDKRATRLGNGLESLVGPAGTFISSAIPQSWISGLLDVADSAAGFSLPENNRPSGMYDLAQCEADALSVEKWAAASSAVTGGASGWFGAAGLAFDVPATLTMAARNVRATGRAFGFDKDTDEEKAFRLMVLELSTAQYGNARKNAASTIKQFSQVLKNPVMSAGVDIAYDWLNEKVIERIARQMGISLTSRKVGQMAPLVGSAFAAVVNARFQSDVSRAARYGYRVRWLTESNMLLPQSREETD